MSDPRRGQTSASNAASDNSCKGRHLAQRGIPEPPRSADAAHGDAIHRVLAKLTHPASSEVLHALPEFTALTASQQDLTESCLKIELQKCLEFFGPDWVKAKVFREQRYWVQVTPTAHHSGQVDVVYRLGPRALIIDYKSLAAEKPESAENLQLRDLVCLAAGHLLISEVGCAIVQPLATHSPIPCLYQKEDIEQSTRDMFLRVTASNDPKSARTAGETQCAFCLAKGKCPEYTAWAGSKLPVPSSLVSVPVEQWTPEMRKGFCDNYDIAADWLSYVWDYMEAGMKKDPAFVPGYVMVPNSPQQPITDPTVLYNRLVELNEGKDVLPRYLKCMNVTKEKVIAMVKEMTGLQGMKLAAKAKELFAGITGEIPKKASLKKAK